MENLIKALEEANKKMMEVIAEIKEINEELKQIEVNQQLLWKNYQQ